MADLNVHLYLHTESDPRLDAIQAQLRTILQKQEAILATETQTLAALAAIDQATTQVANNLTAISSTTQQIATTGGVIKTEMDKLIADIQASGSAVPQTVTDAITALGNKVTSMSTAAQSATDALTAQVAPLQAIATEGAANPVPVNPPPPPPPPGG